MPSTNSDAYLFTSTSAARLPPAITRHSLYGRTAANVVDDATWRELEEERSISRRAYIYREKLFAKHIASNRYTGFKSVTPQSFSTNPELRARVIKFVRREVRFDFLYFRVFYISFQFTRVIY